MYHAPAPCSAYEHTKRDANRLLVQRISVGSNILQYSIYLGTVRWRWNNNNNNNRSGGISNNTHHTIELRQPTTKLPNRLGNDENLLCIWVNKTFGNETNNSNPEEPAYLLCLPLTNERKTEWKKERRNANKLRENQKKEKIGKAVGDK